MIDDVDDIAVFYDGDPEREEQRLAFHQLEHDVTWRYLERHLPARGSILEIGAATGVYTEQLAKRGYAVAAVDLSASLVERAKQRLAHQGLESLVRFAVADARDLTTVPGSGFDAALVMGPLYHLIEESDRKQALRQAARRLRDGGLVFSSLLSRLGLLADLIKDAPHWIEDGAHVRSHLESGPRPDEYPRGGFRGYFARVSEIAPLHESVGFETIVVAGVEPVIASDDDSFNRLEGDQRRLWLDLLHEISADPSVVGASRHLLYVGRKATQSG